MEVVVGTMAGKIAPKLFDFLATNRKLRRELEHDIEYMKNEILMISAAIAEDGDHPPWSSNQVHKAWIQMVRDLSHAIEDCIDHFTCHVTLHPSASWIHRQYHRVKTVRTRNKFATAIRRLRKRSEDASKLRTSYTTNNDGRSNTLKSARAFDEEQTNNTMATAAVGMDAPQAELMELIRETSHSQQPKELMVISLVGFGGLGKTFLAKHVYDTTEIEYEKRAWVCAAEKGPWDILTEILSQLGKPSAITSSGGSAGSSGHLNTLCSSLKECLGNKRFFVVIDDMQEVFWHEIKDAFPVVSGVSSRVMVTTTIQSVANTCSSAHGHVYVMRTLPEDDSRQLFFKEACREDPPPPSDGTQLGSEALKKCDGLPLALITTARFLQSGGDPTREKWANLCKNLGTHLETNEILASMKRVLVRSYTSLGSQDVKTCLLYLGIYPSGHPIRRGSLIRRWLAEGFIKEDNNRSALSIAIDNFNELVNRSIIQPINASSSSRNIGEVKKCQTHGMMLEFILHKSMCENFVTVLYDKDPLPGSNIRWLSLHRKNAAMPKMNPKDLRLVRSLTIFSKVHKSVLDFPKYELLRVLDLEKCDDHLEEKHLREICTNLLLLRYLSLGGTITVTVLPKEINKLRFLETLDVRRTRIEILPTQVIELPCLIHLLGKFRLQQDVGLGGRKMRKLQNWLSENSKLETIAGFIGDKNQELPQLMSHMEHLTKVKIWCDSTADVSSNLSHLSEAIKEFIKRGTDMETSLSLSLNFSGERSQELLNFSLENHNSYYLSSLKLQGNNIFGLPPFVTMLAGLTKLCLSFPHHWLSGDIIDALSRVRGLEYLKLIATQLDKLIIRQGAFRSLRRLCIMVEVMTELEIQDGALPRLDSFWLLCKDLNGFSGTAIQSLPRLKEVALYDGVSYETKHEWKEAVKNQPRRPKLLFVKMKPMKIEPAEEIIPTAVANDTTATEFDVGSEPAAEISTALTNTDTTTKEGELAENSQSPVAPPTDMKLSMATPDNVISTGESVQVDGGQHDDDEKEDLDSIEDPKDFATKNDTTTQVIDQMNKGSSEEEMEGVVGLEGLQMEDGTQERGLQNKHRLRTRLLSLVAIGVFRQKSGQGRLVPGLG